MQIELKCKINVKNEKRKPNLPMLPRFAPVAYSNLFSAASVRRQLPSVQKPIAVRIASNESAAVTFPSPSASAAASAAPLR